MFEGGFDNTKSKANELAVENVFGIRVSVLEDRPQCLVNAATFGFNYSLVTELYFHRQWNLICQ
jgi:hypothetical protein